MRWALRGARFLRRRHARRKHDGYDGDDAIYRRNRYLADNYGVNITNKDIVAFSSAMGSGKGFTELYMNYMSGNNVYDAAMIGTYDAANLAYSGVLQDLNETPYINLQKDYWDQRANADLSVSGRMYYSTGDISLLRRQARRSPR